MELLPPGFMDFHGTLEHRVGRGDFMVLHRPRSTAVTGRPVRTAQPGIGQAHEAAEHNDAEGEQNAGPGDAMKMLIGIGHGLILRVLPDLFSNRWDRIRPGNARRQIHPDRSNTRGIRPGSLSRAGRHLIPHWLAWR